MGNKLGPAIAIALGIFIAFLVVTGKLQNLIDAANAKPSGDGVLGPGSKGSTSPTPAGQPDMPNMGSGSWAASTAGSGAGFSRMAAAIAANTGFGSYANKGNPNTLTAKAGNSGVLSYLPEFNTDGSLNAGNVYWNEWISGQAGLALLSKGITGPLATPIVNGETSPIMTTPGTLSSLLGGPVQAGVMA